MEATGILGLLGWSNKRSGVEFYRWDDKIIPRHGSEWGDLLVLEEPLVNQEGAPVLVVVLPRATSKDQALLALSRTLDAVNR